MRFLPSSAAVYVNPHTPSGQSRVYRVTQLRTDDVHFRHRASSPQGSSSNGCCLCVTTNQSTCASLFPHPLLHEVGMLKVSVALGSTHSSLVVARRGTLAPDHRETKITARSSSSYVPPICAHLDEQWGCSGIPGIFFTLECKYSNIPLIAHYCIRA